MDQALMDPHVPDSKPTRQGRGLIRMLFRSSRDDGQKGAGEAENHNNQTDCTSFWKHSQSTFEQRVFVPGATSKFASLKRKLFPSQNRRHPRQVPTLTSPISVPANASLTPFKDSSKLVVLELTSRGNEEIEHNQATRAVSSASTKSSMKHLEPKNFKKSPEKTIAQAKRFDDRGAAGRTILLGNYDDQDLQSAVETLDLESSLVDTKTLQDMSHAIDDLRAWKKAHEQETRDALNKLQCSQQEEEKLQFDDNEQPQDDTDNDSLLQQQQRSRNVQAIDHRKEYEAYQLECNLFPAKSETTDIEQALQITDFEGLALSRLRKKVFELDVKQRQEALLYELQKADADLDMNIVDVQNFTSELNAILAQFDKITLC